MYAIASKTGITVHFIGVNGFTLCGRTIRDTTDSMAGMKLCVRCNLAEQRTNPILAMIGNREVEEAPITDVDGETEIAETVSDGIVIAPVEIQIPAILSEYGYSAHGNTYAVDYNRVHEEMLARKATFNMRTSHSNPIDDVIRFARESIKALTPTLLATKTAFESLRDDESANPNHVDLAYQVYSDTHRAIEEYKRTISYAAGEHTCENHYSEIGMTEECAYGCKIYRCSKCQDERTLHNATYGCRYPA